MHVTYEIHDSIVPVVCLGVAGLADLMQVIFTEQTRSGKMLRLVCALSLLMLSAMFAAGLFAFSCIAAVLLPGVVAQGFLFARSHREHKAAKASRSAV
ncbi:hypothetical protein [Paraburkholderia sp. SIMBA_054]|uniref:hypothetical protein n=1 Tax=Paraburkholderia sp. SIMBA_054 TaxID=3085795 RepID=UPI00397B19C2